MLLEILWWGRDDHIIIDTIPRVDKRNKTFGLGADRTIGLHTKAASLAFSG